MKSKSQTFSRKSQLIYLAGNLFANGIEFAKLIKSHQADFTIIDVNHVLNAYVFYARQNSLSCGNPLVIRYAINKTVLIIENGHVNISGIQYEHFNLLVGVWRVSYLRQPIFFNTVIEKILLLVAKKYKKNATVCLVGPPLYANSLPVDNKISIWQLNISRKMLVANITAFYLTHLNKKIDSDNQNRLFEESLLLETKTQDRQLKCPSFNFDNKDAVQYDSEAVFAFFDRWKNRSRKPRKKFLKHTTTDQTREKTLSKKIPPINS